MPSICRSFNLAEGEGLMDPSEELESATLGDMFAGGVRRDDGRDARGARRRRLWQRGTAAAGLLAAVAIVALLAPRHATGSTEGLTGLFQAPSVARSMVVTTEAPSGAVAEPVPAVHRSPPPSGDRKRHSSPPLPALPVAAVGVVASADADTDYVMEEGSWGDHADHVPSQKACAGLCASSKACGAWTWLVDAKLKGGNPGQCWLKGGKVVKKAAKRGAFSALVEHGVSVAADTPVAEDAPAKTHESEAEKEQTKRDKACAEAGTSCLKSKCCKDPGTRCFAKDEFWGECMAECAAGPNPRDQVSPAPWACKALGERAPGQAKACAAAGESCAASRCCQAGGQRCYEKNATFATCKASCAPGPDMMDEDWGSWSCRALGPRTQGAAPWVKTHCAAPGADCSKSMCCQEPGAQCYRQSEFWAQCRANCTPGEKVNAGDLPWECGKVGTRTPETASDEEAPAVGRVAPWAESHCSGQGKDCRSSRCCHQVGATCYAKSDGWAACKTDCSTKMDPKDDNATWSCDALGPKSIGLALKGYPSLFCFTLYMPSRYEGPLMQAQLKEGAGIFSCDGYDVLASENNTLGTGKDGRRVEAILIPKIEVGVSQDGTAGNAKLFMAVWDRIIADGRFRNFDWTIKVDPDAVIVPWRVRDHMRPHTGKSVYVVNCNKFPGSPNFPMMYGAVEIFSNPAMIAYAMGSWKCGQELPWGSWGEDYYMTHCLDFLGVGRVGDFGVLGDNLCTGANCADTYTASFHPFKELGTWMQCWGKATAPPS